MKAYLTKKRTQETIYFYLSITLSLYHSIPHVPLLPHIESGALCPCPSKSTGGRAFLSDNLSTCTFHPHHHKPLNLTPHLTLNFLPCCTNNPFFFLLRRDFTILDCPIRHWRETEGTVQCFFPSSPKPKL